MTSPLVPPDINLQGMPFMPLDVNRLRDSQLAIAATGDEFRAAVMLWCASWNQIPAASLPADDQSLAAYAGYGRDVKSWRKVKAGAMRGFVLCDDGRFYHPVVAEKAMEAWAERTEYRAEKENEKERKERERAFRRGAFAALRGMGITLAWNTPTGILREMCDKNGVTGHAPVTVTGHAPDTAKTGTGIYQERESETRAPEVDSAGDSDASDPPRPSQAGTACRLMRDAGCTRTNPSHVDLLAALDEGVTPEVLRDTAAEGIAAGKNDPFAWAIKTARSRHAQGATTIIQGANHGHAAGGTGRKLSAVEQVEQAIRDRRARAQSGDDTPPALGHG
jgi:hypothetical protein